jgi:methanogenic corrinoid protein MtbC1
LADPGSDIHSDLALSPPRGAALAILRALAKSPCTVNELVMETGLSQPNVSNHLARLRARRWVRSQRQGRHICYFIAHPAVAQFLEALAEVREAVAAEGGAREDALTAFETAYLEAVLAMREEEARAVVERAVAAGLSWDTIYLRIFRPVLERIGVLWSEQGLPVSVEHAATAITVRLMHRLQAAQSSAPRREASPDASPTLGCRAFVACVAGELHAVGARMVADFLRASGWDVTFLDANVPAPALVEAAVRHLPHAIFLSATTEARRDAVRDALQALRAWRGHRPLPLLVAGGQFFRQTPDVWAFDVVGDSLPDTLLRVEVCLADEGARR